MRVGNSSVLFQNDDFNILLYWFARADVAISVP